jgi:4-amino-4-deoxy-L-arabinose transferase-like glycosyltransferase
MDSPAETRRRGWSHSDILALAAIGLFIALASYRIDLPGLQYDETLFVQPAIGAPETLFLHKTWNGIPLMVMEYLGALKVWIYAPIFHLFGVSPFTIRFPAILISALTLFLLYRIIKREAGPAAACFLVWLMAVDPAFVFHSRLDWGPVVLMMFLKVAMIGVWFQFVRAPSFWKLAGLAALGLLGLWDKLNFAWFAAGLGAAAVLCYPRSFLQLLSGRGKGARFAIEGSVALVLALAVFLGARQGSFSGETLTRENLERVWGSTLHTLNANALTTFLVTHPVRYPDTDPWRSSEEVLAGNPMRSSIVPVSIRLAVSAFLIALAIVRVRRAPSGALRRICFFTLLWLVPLLCILGTTASGGLQKPHHLMMVYPFSMVVLALLLKLGLDMREGPGGRLAIALVVVTGVMAMCSSVAVDGKVFHHLVTDKPLDARWSPRVYELVEYIDAESTNADWIVSADWGIHNSLHALSTDAARRKMGDLWLVLKFVHNDSAAAEEISRKLNSNRRTLLVSYAGGNAVQRQSERNCAALVGGSGLACERIKEISQGDKVVYEIREVRGAGRESTPGSTPPGAIPDPQ